MKKASTSFLVVFFAAALISFDGFAQGRPGRPRPGQVGQPQRPVPQPQRPLPIPHPMPRPQLERQVIAGSLITLHVNQVIRGSGEIGLKRLVKQQTGLTLEGAEIQRVVVDGQSLQRYGRPASLIVLLNGRMEGREKDMDLFRGRTPFPLNSFEEVRQSLVLLVRGEALVQSVHLRIGRVRPLRYH